MASQDIGQSSAQENTNPIDSSLVASDNTSTSEGDNLQVPASSLVDNQANNVATTSPTTETTSPAPTEVRTVSLPVSPLTTSTTSRADSEQESTSSEACDCEPIGSYVLMAR